MITLVVIVLPDIERILASMFFPFINMALLPTVLFAFDENTESTFNCVAFKDNTIFDSLFMSLHRPQHKQMTSCMRNHE